MVTTIIELYNCMRPSSVGSAMQSKPANDNEVMRDSEKTSPDLRFFRGQTRKNANR